MPGRRVSEPFLYLAVFLIYAICTLVFFHPVVGQLNGVLIGPPEDNLNDLWNLWYVQGHIGAPVRAFFHTDLIKFPEGASLHYQDISYIVTLPLVAIQKLLGLGAGLPALLGLENGAILASFVLAGMGGFVLTRHFTRDRLGAVVGGFVFAFCPAHIERSMHHIGLATIEFLPFTLLSLTVFFQGGRFRYAALAVLCMVADALCSWYYLIYDIYLLLFLAGVVAFQQRRITPNLLGRSLIVLAGVAVLLSPLILPMLMESWRSPEIGEDNFANYFVTDLWALFTPYPLHVLGDFTRNLTNRFTGNEWEATGYLGLFNLFIVLVAWPFWRKKPDRQLLWLLLGCCLFVLIAFGRRMHVAGLPTIGLPTAIPTWLPLFRNAHTPARAMIYAQLFFAVGVGLSLRMIVAARRMHAAGLAVLVALMVIDFYPTRITATPAACTMIDATIRADADSQTGVVDLPLSYAVADAAMLGQICHHHPIVTAITSRSSGPTLLNRLETDLPAQHRQLLAANVHWIVLHHRLPGHAMADDDGHVDAAAYGREYQIVQTDAERSLLRVTPLP